MNKVAKCPIVCVCMRVRHLVRMYQYHKLSDLGFQDCMFPIMYLRVQYIMARPT